MTAAKKSADCPIGHPIVPSPILTQHQLNNFAPALKCGCFVYFTEFAQPGLWPLFRHLALSNIADLSLTLIPVIACLSSNAQPIKTILSRTRSLQSDWNLAEIVQENLLGYCCIAVGAGAPRRHDHRIKPTASRDQHDDLARIVKTASKGLRL